MTRPFAAKAAPRAAKRLVILGATGSNEAAVAAYLDGRIGFGTIWRLVERTLAAMRAAAEIAAPATVAEALAIHHIARDRAAALLA